MKLFKVWSPDRNQKVFVGLEDQDDEAFYNSFILKASEKLKINGSSVVLENDGTLIDDGATIKMLTSETLMLLSVNEKWMPATSTCSTVSATSSLNSTISDFLRNQPDVNIDNNDETVEDEHTGTAVLASGISESTWQKFEIPWHLLNKSAAADMEKGVRTTDYVNKIVNITVDATREVTKFPGNKAFRIVAKKIVNKYAQFEDVDEDGIVIGNGYHSLFKKLVERNSYLNRSHKRPANSLQALEVPPKKIKKILNCKAGCNNWQPILSESDDSPETLQEKKNFLNENEFHFNENSIKLLNETYGMQRQFLNNPNPPSVQDIRKEWPVLFEKQVILRHFQKLMGWNAGFRSIFDAKKKKLINFGLRQKYLNAVEDNENDDSQLLTTLIIIAKYFKESIDLLVVDISESGTENDKLILQLAAPCIVISNVQNKKLYRICVEKEKILECDDFVSAFEILFALYYNLNMCYPKEASSILEFVQRYFFKINPMEGTKSKKKSLNKIISLITKLRDD